MYAFSHPALAQTNTGLFDRQTDRQTERETHRETQTQRDKRRQKIDIDLRRLKLSTVCHRSRTGDEEGEYKALTIPLSVVCPLTETLYFLLHCSTLAKGGWGPGECSRKNTRMEPGCYSTL